MCVRELSVSFKSGLSLEAMEVELALGNEFSDVGQMIRAFYLHDMQSRGLHQQAEHQSAARYAVAASSRRPSRRKKSARTLGRRWYPRSAGPTSGSFASSSTSASAASGPSSGPTAIDTATARFSSTTGDPVISTSAS